MKRNDEILLAYRKERERFYLKAVDILLKAKPSMPLDDIYLEAKTEAKCMWLTFAEGLEESEEEFGQSRWHANYFYDDKDE